MSSLAVGRALERELYWLGDLFTAAELVAADLLLRLRGDEGDEEERVDEKAAASSAATSFSSRRSASSWCEDLTVAEEGDRDGAASSTTFSSKRSASSCCEDLTVAQEEEERDGAEVASTTFSPKRSASSCREDLAVVEGLEPPSPPPWIAKETAPSPGLTTQLDRRARKRFRLLSEIYAATAPVSSPAAAKRRKRTVESSD